MNNLRLSEIYIYPIKSLGGISLKHSKVTSKGLEFDRRWMLIDEDGIFITQRKYAILALLDVMVIENQLTVQHKHDPDNKLSFLISENNGKTIPVTIWDDQSTGIEVSTAVSEWFSVFMGKSVRLVIMPEKEKRMVDPRYAKNEELVGFSDGYPFLIIGQAALDGLNERLSSPVPMDRFRPNFVFTGGDAHLEDQFDTFNLGGVQFSAVKPCARCVLTTVDQQTAAKSAEPLKTLAEYRTMNKKVMFGQNLIHKGSGTVYLGDQLEVTAWKSEA